MRTSQKVIPYLALVLLTLLYGGVAMAHAIFAPLTTGPDELAHYEYVNFVADNGHLPLDPTQRAEASYKSDQPPLFHLIAALPASWVDPTGPPFLKRVADHPRRQLIERTRHAWGLYNTEDEQWPYGGEVLRWQVGRWVAVGFGAATVVATFFVARFVFESVWLALAAATIVGFTPRFILTGSMLNYETLLAFVTTLFLGLLLWAGRLARRPLSQSAGSTDCDKRDLRPVTGFFLLGWLAGVAITIKLSALILPLEIALVAGLIGWHVGWSWRQISGYVLTAALGCLLAVSWWFGFVLYQFNSIAEDGWWVGLLRPLIAADASDATTNRLLSWLTGGAAGSTAAIENLDSGPLWAWAVTVFRTYWFVGIEGEFPLSPVMPLLILGVCLLAGWGLLRRSNPKPLLAVNRLSDTFRNQTVVDSTGRQQKQPPSSPSAPYLKEPSRLITHLLLLHLTLPFVLPLLRYAATFSLADTAQGRHILFSAAPAGAILLIVGLQNLATVKAIPFRYTIPLLPAALLLWTVAQLWTMSWAYLPPLPVRTTAMPIANSVHQPLNEAVTLVGYGTQRVAEGQLLQVDLVWRATGLSRVDYLTDLRLQDGSTGETVSRWQGYSAQGRYPTRAWDVGDVVRDVVWLPLNSMASGRYSLTLNLQPMSRRNPTPVLTKPLLLTTVDLSPPPPLDSPQIWRAGRPVQPGDIYRYRETVLLTLPLSDSRLTPTLHGLTSGLTISPTLTFDGAALFIIGAAWQTDEYHLSSNPSHRVRLVNRWPRQFTEPPMSRRIEANFNQQVKLVGYNLHNNRAEAGGGIPITLHWQGLDWLGDDLTIFAKPIISQTAYGGRDRLPQEGYRTLYWAADEFVTDPFAVPLSPNAPDGIYYLHVGLYPQPEPNAAPISLPRIENGHSIDATSVTIGPIKVGPTPPQYLATTIDPQNVINQSFGDDGTLTLLGYNVEECTVGATPCELIARLYWQIEQRLPLDYTIFVHLRNQTGAVVAQRDQPPPYPTSLFDVGERFITELAVPIDTELPSGQYEVVLGWYDWRTGQRLTVPNRPDDTLFLTHLER